MHTCILIAHNTYQLKQDKELMGDIDCKGVVIGYDMGH
jgi:hypothetical protein